MPVTIADLRKIKPAINEIAERYGVERIRCFGSVSRGSAEERSDIDLLISLRPGYTLLNAGGFLMDMQDLLGVKVDIVTEGGLHHLIKDKILQEAVEI